MDDADGGPAPVVPTAPSTSLTPTDWLVLTWVLSAGAAIVHLVVVPAHFRDTTASGVFFVVAAVAQAATAFALRRSAPRGLLIGVLVLNLTLIVVWGWSRATGLPIGPTRGQREAAGLADVVATMYELVIVWATFRLLLARAQASPKLALASSTARIICSMSIWTTAGAVYAAPH